MLAINITNVWTVNLGSKRHRNDDTAIDIIHAASKLNQKTMRDFDFKDIRDHDIHTLEQEFLNLTSKGMRDRCLIAKSIPKKSRNNREELLVAVGMDIIRRRRPEERGDVSVMLRTDGQFFKWNQYVRIDMLKCRTKDCFD